MKELLIGQLRQGNNGSQILKILDTIVADIEENDDSLQLTSEEIDF